MASLARATAQIPNAYRIFAALVPPVACRADIAAAAAWAGPLGSRIRDAHWHMTLCVVSESRTRLPDARDRFEAALAGHRLRGCYVPLLRLVATTGGASLRPAGAQEALRTLQAGLVARLAAAGVAPLPRRHFAPHVTLGYDGEAAPVQRIPPIEWLATEIALIESLDGCTVHNQLATIPLLDVAQPRFDF